MKYHVYIIRPESNDFFSQIICVYENFLKANQSPQNTRVFLYYCYFYIFFFVYKLRYLSEICDTLVNYVIDI